MICRAPALLAADVCFSLAAIRRPLAVFSLLHYVDIMLMALPRCSVIDMPRRYAYATRYAMLMPVAFAERRHYY